jgi:hypothetical protein
VAVPLDCTKQYSFGKYWEKGQSNSGKSISQFTLNCKTITKLAFAKESTDTFFPF